MSEIKKVNKSSSILSGFSQSLSAETLQVIGLVVAIALISIGMQTQFDVFLSTANIEVMIVNFLPEAIIALGMTMVIITGGIDLSVAGVYPFAAIVVGKLLLQDLPVPIAIALALAASAGIGAINAFMFTTFKVHPFIATLATLLTLRGVNIVITNGATVSGFPDGFKVIGQERMVIGSLISVPISVVIWLVIALLIGYSLANHRFWRYSYFIGGNRRSARMSGIKVEQYLYFVYMLSATLAGLAGIIVAAQFGAASNSYGQNLELRVITAVVIGGASLFGGVGSIPGSMLGVLFLAIVYNAFSMSGISTYWQDVVIGVMLLIAVFMTELLTRRRTK